MDNDQNLTMVWDPGSSNWLFFGFNFSVVIALIIVAMVDFYVQKIPIYVLEISFILALIFILLNSNPAISLVSRFVGAGVSLAFFGWQYILSRGHWIGAGDIWLGGWLGFLFGWNTIVLVLAGGYGLAAVVSIIYFFMSHFKNQFKIPQTIPLGGFLCVSGIIFFLHNLWQI